MGRENHRSSIEKIVNNGRRSLEFASRRSIDALRSSIDLVSVRSRRGGKHPFLHGDYVSPLGHVHSLLMDYERNADMEAVRKRLVAGQVYFRGFDQEDRPIVWVKSFSGLRGAKKTAYPDIFLALVWVGLWALAQRPGLASEIRYIVDDEQRLALDFAVDFCKSLATFLARIGNAVPALMGPITIFSPRTGLAASLKVFTKSAPAWKSSIQFEKDRSYVNFLVNDQKEIPATFQNSGGKVFEASEETLGCFENLIGRNAFLSISQSDLANPDMSKSPFAGSLASTHLTTTSTGHSEDTVVSEVERAPKHWSSGTRKQGASGGRSTGQPSSLGTMDLIVEEKSADVDSD